jgi:hypothetical protein
LYLDLIKANITNNRLVSDLDFLVDSSQLLANTHQVWASTIERDLEDPLVASVQEIMEISKVLCNLNQNNVSQNKIRIQSLIGNLHKEEDFSYKMKKKKQRDLNSLSEVKHINTVAQRETKFGRRD